MTPPPSPALDPLITNPNQKAPARARTVQGVLTFIAWLVYAWLWLPLITAVAWWAGIRTSYIELVVRDYQHDVGTLGIVLTLAAGAVVLLIGWAEFNRYKFAGRDRRVATASVEPAEVARALRASPEVLAALVSSKTATLRMDEHGAPLGVDTRLQLSA